jgi:hypothetical protein
MNEQILVVADPGPVRRVLVARRDLSVLWVGTMAHAAPIIAARAPRVCLIGGRHEPSQLAKFCSMFAAGGASCAWIVDEIDDRVKGVHQILRTDVEGVLRWLSDNTSIRFGLDPRVTYTGPIEVELGGEWIETRAFDLSKSGIAFERPNGCPAHGRLSLRIPASRRVVQVSADVVRSFEKDGVSALGLRFAELDSVARTAIEREVASAKAPDNTADLFAELTEDLGGVKPLRTMDLSVLKRESTTIDSYREVLKAIIAPSAVDLFETMDAPAEWLVKVAGDMTPIERAAITGKDVPEWVHDGLTARIQIAEHRACSPQEPLPSAIRDLAYRAFGEASKNEATFSPELFASAAMLRAALFGVLMWRPLPRPAAFDQTSRSSEVTPSVRTVGETSIAL